MNSIKECFDTILRGNKNDSRLAARRVRKLLYNFQSGKNKFKDIEYIINSASQEYGKISESWRQENFVVAISVIYFLHNREEQPDFLFPWLFQLLQHPNGIIRYAAVRMLTNELGPLTAYIRIPDYKSERLKPEQADSILYALFLNLNKLSNALWQEKYKRYKYIDSLPASSYKSVQMVLAELEDLCGQEYMNYLIQRSRDW